MRGRVSHAISTHRFGSSMYAGIVLLLVVHDINSHVLGEAADMILPGHSTARKSILLDAAIG